ncbi:MAG: dihydrofolate reductase [Steroidobacteraceae bacterium]
MSENGVIGRGNALPWHLPTDLQHFKALTLRKPVLMGRKTHESIGRALPGRRNLVLTRKAIMTEGVEVVRSLDEALARLTGVTELMVIGGAQLYAEALPRADRVYLTRVHAVIDGDAFFPELDSRQWRVTDERRVLGDGSNDYAMTFSTLERIPVQGAR